MFCCWLGLVWSAGEKKTREGQTAAGLSPLNAAATANTAGAGAEGGSIKGPGERQHVEPEVGQIGKFSSWFLLRQSYR